MSAGISAPVSVPSPESAAPASLVRALKRAVFWGVAGLLLFGPLAFGAVEPWSLFVMQAGAAALLALWALATLLSGDCRIRRNALHAPLFLFAMLVTWQVAAGTSAYLFDTQAEAMKLATYGIFFFLAAQTGEAEDWRRLAQVLIGFGFLLALFAVIQDLTSNGKLYWLRLPTRGGAIYGPYVNRNHYAGLMEMLAPFAVVAALSRGTPVEKRTLLAFAAVIMAGSIFLSRSRGGLLALAVQLVVLSVVDFPLRMRRGVVAALLAVGLAAGGLVYWLDKGRMVSRLENLTEQGMESVEGVRWTIALDSLKMVRERPVTGWGLGTFPVVYPQYRSFYTNKFVNQAHNDYLQALVETGVAGFALVVWGLLAVYREGFRNLAQAPAVMRAPVLAAVVGCTGLLVHSFLDFNLHIPANAALFAVLCAAVSFRPVAPLPQTRSAEHVGAGLFAAFRKTRSS